MVVVEQLGQRFGPGDLVEGVYGMVPTVWCLPALLAAVLGHSSHPPTHHPPTTHMYALWAASQLSWLHRHPKSEQKERKEGR